jgi:phospholipid/cholesterol/gamma-HCH transport system substrate-binding protein
MLPGNKNRLAFIGSFTAEATSSFFHLNIKSIMATNKHVATGVGLFILAGIGALLFLAFQVSNLGSTYQGDAFRVTALFDNVGGLKPKAPITLSGVKIGQVESIAYDLDNLQASVVLAIQTTYRPHLTQDTFAKILTSGLLGEKYIGLALGGSDELLQPGDIITTTQSALVLEDMIGRFLFNQAQEGE